MPVLLIKCIQFNMRWSMKTKYSLLTRKLRVRATTSFLNWIWVTYLMVTNIAEKKAVILNSIWFPSLMESCKHPRVRETKNRTVLLTTTSSMMMKITKTRCWARGISRWAVWLQAPPAQQKCLLSNLTKYHLASQAWLGMAPPHS